MVYVSGRIHYNRRTAIMRRHPFVLNVVFLLSAYCFLPTSYCFLSNAFAQSATATLSGEVSDQNGAVVVGANITLLNAATSLRRQATTNDGGHFTFPLLPPGTYTVAAL